MSGFTLVELLVVMSVILLAAVVSLPAMTALSKSSSRRAAISLTMAALDQARGLAVSRSIPHYLVFADSDPSWPERYRHRAFGIFAETYDPEHETYHRDLVGSWTPLPDGIAFKPDVADTLFGAPREMFFCHPAGRETGLPFFKFTATGDVEAPLKAGLARVRLFEGFIDESGKPVATNAEGAASEVVVKVSLQSGRVQREVADVGH